MLMLKRISRQSLYQQGPRVVESLLSLGNIHSNSNLGPALLHLIRLRVSQINQCGFCLHMHAAEARKDGESQERLDVLAAWEEAACFSSTERLALKWAEYITLISHGCPDDSVYQQCLDVFGENDLIELTAVILQINSWNRISISFGFDPGIRYSPAVSCN